MTTEDATALTREQIVSAQDIVTESVDVPEWGGHVLIRSLTARKRDAFEASVALQNGKQRMNWRDMRARLVALCLVDENGNRLFGDNDIATLSGKSGKALDRLFDACQKLNKMSDDDVADLEKNCDSGPVDE